MTDKQHNEVVEDCAKRVEAMRHFYTVKIDDIVREIRLLKKGASFCEIKQQSSLGKQ